MWRSAFVGLLVAVCVFAGMRVAHGQDETTVEDLEFRVRSLEGQVAYLQDTNLVWKVAPGSEVWSNSGFANFDEDNKLGYIYYQYCQIKPLSVSYLEQYELRCMKIDPES